MKKFYSKFFSLLCTLMMVAGSAFAQDGINLPLTNGAGSVDGVSYVYGSCDWAGSTNIYSNCTEKDGWGYIKIVCLDKNIVKVELTTTGDAGTVYEYNNNGEVTTSGNTVIWTGSAQELGFTSSADVYVNKIVVYTESNGEIVKECTVGATTFNPKDGKIEGSLNRYINVYLESTTLGTNYTGSANCPEGVTLVKDEDGVNLIKEFNYFDNQNYISIVLEEKGEEEEYGIGTYTLTIPEGIVPFQGGKWNKEITVTWTVVAPDLRTKVNTVFDFTTAEYETEVLVNYEAAMTTAKIGLNTDFNYYEEGKCITAKNGTITFTAPDYTSIVKVTLSNGSNETNVNLTADGECEVVTGNPLTWTGNASSVTLTSATRNYVTSAVVTLAIDDEEAFKANFLTGIDTVLSTEASNKVYDLIGRRVVNAQNGLFIVNGKKVIR